MGAILVDLGSFEETLPAERIFVEVFRVSSKDGFDVLSDPVSPVGGYQRSRCLKKSSNALSPFWRAEGFETCSCRIES